MTKNTNQTPRSNKPATNRKTSRVGLGCSLALVALLVGSVLALIVVGPRALSFLQGAQLGATPTNVNDSTSPEKLAAQRQQESAQLHGYGWVNQAGGIAHIPIDRAINLVIQKGLPVGGVTAKVTAAKETTATAAIDLAHVSFQNNVLPIFQQHCLKCHGSDNPDQGLELSNYHTIMSGSENGTVITPGNPDKSYLVEMVVTKKMPKKGAPLSSAEIDIIIAWIKAGAKDDTGTVPKASAVQTSSVTTTPITSTAVTTATAPVDLANVSFKANVLPIFEQHCTKCHGGDNPEEGLELTSYSAVKSGSQNGSVVEPGDPANSYLVKMVVEKKMPKKGPPLSSTEINTISAWIKAGAKDN